MPAAIDSNQGMDPYPQKMWEPTDLGKKEMEKFRVHVNHKHNLTLGRCP